MKLPYSRQCIDNDDIREVNKVLRSPLVTQGPAIRRFEHGLAKTCNISYAVAFSSGTAALHAAFSAAGIGKGDEVIIPALTFVATANAALYCGARIKFADIDPETGLIDLSDVQKKITPRTRCLVAVDYSGRPAALGPCRELAKKNGLIFIADAAHSLGARYGGNAIGCDADMTMLSFHPVKSITTGEGGAILTNNKKYRDYLTMFRSHGLTRDPKILRDKRKASWHQEMHLLGANYRMTDIQAALGLSQLRKLTRFIKARRNAALRYDRLLKGISGITLPPNDGPVRSSWHLYVIKLPAKRRDRIFERLRQKGIGVQVHYLPVYLHPYYQKLGYRRGLCPNAEHFAASVLSLPLFPDISVKEQEYVAKTLARVIVQK